MPSAPVYIRNIEAFLPGEPVDNDHIEAVLGMLGDKPRITSYNVCYTKLLRPLIHNIIRTDLDAKNYQTFCSHNPAS